MKSLIALAIAAMLSVSVPSSPSSAAPTKYDPDDGYHQYIKWIGVARKAASQRYPQASLVDLLYVGCKSEWPSAKQFVYKFWMQENGKEFGVYVTVDEAKDPGKAFASRIEKTDARNTAYGRWERYAEEAVKAKYPDAEIRSYRPFGCACLNKQASSQIFRFWIEPGGIIEAAIEYDVKTDKVLAVKFRPLRSF
ncbi:DUF3889 domain-containing protein [Paenibacillus rhizovicinus]|uniref:DUF3889 domain-containing protein n=1 Tax=Paenibacillus rhizovicinus TaxID=2704463 RepID=A0A6C0P0N8_9BACL|nr:DUF3889 domain-containing protein [Paenibacillus rhizovicinus]QHW32038.1 DUF3889 domain-containing protein [Paenibacillus rhizovicinus]